VTESFSARLKIILVYAAKGTSGKGLADAYLNIHVWSQFGPHVLLMDTLYNLLQSTAFGAYGSD